MHIQELAHRLQITPRAIRFYEEKGLIAPQKDVNSGYRRFGEEDVWRLQTVITLREVGMPIDEIKRLLTQLDGESGSLLHYLEVQRAYMYDRWVELKNAIQTTEAMIERVKQDDSLDPGSLFTLAEANKRLRQTKRGWADRWDFNEMAMSYDEMVVRDKKGFNPHERYEEVLASIFSFVQPRKDETGLDAGTGTGNLAQLFTNYSVTMCAFDQSIEMLKQCKRKNPQIETKLGNFFAIPYLDHSFDFAVSSYALHHLTDEQKCLALVEFQRVLKPGGRLAIADLMFVDQVHRDAQLQALRQSRQEEIIANIEDEYYADRSVLENELERLGFRVLTKQLTPYVHLVGAART